jgi:hypothetical protein
MHTMHDFVFSGFINEMPDNNEIYYIASSPPDYRYSFPGSGLPFANAEDAFEGTPNKGVVQLNAGRFTVNLQYPNAFYEHLGSKYVPPTLFVKYTVGGKQKEKSFKISDGIPFRTLTYSPLRTGAEFYATQFHLPVRSQESILRSSGYPRINKMPADHWGLRPPL